MKYITTINEKNYEVEIGEGGAVTVDGVSYSTDMVDLGNQLSSLIINGCSHEVVAAKAEGAEWDVLLSGQPFAVTVQDELSFRVSQAQQQAEAAGGSVTLKSPMPGIILRTPLSVGDAVAKGDTLIVLESMKMENELKSSRNGVVEAVAVEEGATVEKGQVLVTVSSEGEG